MGASPPPEPARSLPGQVRSLLEARGAPAQDKAWSEFLEAYSRLILYVARRTPGGYDAVMDRYAFVLEKLRAHDFRRLHSYVADGRGKFTTWLTVVAHRLCLDFNRLKLGRVTAAAAPGPPLRRRLVELVYVAPELMDQLPDKAMGIDDDLHQQLVLERLEAAIANLGPSDQLLLALRYHDGLPVREIAVAMSLATQFHVYRRLTRVHHALRQFLTSGAADRPPAVQYEAEP